MTNFLQLFLLGLLEGGLYAMVAAAIVLVYKSSHVVSLAHGQLMGYGALAFWFTLTVLKMPLVLSILIALVCLAVFGWLIERIAMRPLIGQPLFAAFLTTFALFLVGDGIFQLILKEQFRIRYGGSRFVDRLRNATRIGTPIGIVRTRDGFTVVV